MGGREVGSYYEELLGNRVIVGYRVRVVVGFSRRGFGDCIVVGVIVVLVLLLSRRFEFVGR